MTTVKDIVDYMETIAPQSKKESWDNVGLHCGRENEPVHTVLVALDPFEDVAEEAVEIGAELILTHHPLIFHPLYSLTDNTAIGRTIYTLLRHDISAFHAHTNLDMQKLVSLFPLTQGITLMKNTFLGISQENVLLPVTIMLAVTAVCTGLAIRFFRWE